MKGFLLHISAAVPALLLLLTALGWGREALLAVLFSAIHEGGHLAAALLLGYSPAAVTFGFFGGALTLKEGFLKPYKELVLHLAGPFCNLALALLHGPELVLLDEPTLGLDVLAKRRMIDCLRQLNREDGATILVTSHDMDDLTAMANRLILLNNGAIAFDGAGEELIRRTGDKRTLILTCDGERPEIDGAIYQRTESGRHVYAFEGSDAPRVLSATGRLNGLKDAETGHAPIEEVIAGLYQAWQS